jgi:O-antigen/teichoic acid export membrane protein
MVICLKIKNKLISNVIASGLFQFFFLIVPVITTPYVTRIFSPQNMGLYATSYAVAMFLMQVAHFGLPIYGIRVIAQTRDINKSFFELFSLQLIMCSITFVVFNIFNFYLIKEKQVYFYQSLLILVTVFDVSWFFIGIEEIKKNLVRNAFSKMIVIIFIFLFVKESSDLLLYIKINVLGNLLGNLTMILQLKNYISWNRLSLKLNSLHLRSSLGLLIPQSVDSGKNAISRLILVYSSSYNQGGLYDQGIKVIIMLNGIIGSMGGAITPRIAYLVKKERYEDIVEISTNFLNVIYISSIVIISGVLVTAGYFTNIFFGESFKGVSSIMQIGSFSLLFGSVSLFLGKSLLVPFSRDKIYRNISLQSSIILIISNIILDPFYGATGAAVSFAISSVFWCITSFIGLKDIIKLENQIYNILFCVIFILLNYYLISNLEKYWYKDNSIFMMITNGFSSVLISLGFILFFLYIKKIDVKHLIGRK